MKGVGDLRFGEDELHRIVGDAGESELLHRVQVVHEHALRVRRIKIDEADGHIFPDRFRVDAAEWIDVRLCYRGRSGYRGGSR